MQSLNDPSNAFNSFTGSEHIFKWISLNNITQTAVILFAVFTSIFIAWKLITAVNYGYSLWYDILNINEHIAEYGPQNRRGKKGLEQLDKAAHVYLFEQINSAVNNEGAGLKDITFNSMYKSKAPLLEQNEVVHLKDVSALISKANKMGWVACVMLLLCIAFVRWKNLAMPSLSLFLKQLGLLLVSFLVAVVVIRPEPIYDFLHEVAFPQRHQKWFFYYQDSLMTTLMDAPDLFYAISAMWLVLASITYVLIAQLLSKFLKFKATH